MRFNILVFFPPRIMTIAPPAGYYPMVATINRAWMELASQAISCQRIPVPPQAEIMPVAEIER
jgi:hypothetical protein